MIAFIFFIYLLYCNADDALPHYSVGEWPANAPTYGLDLGTVLTMLQLEMQNVGVPLSGYWLDSPMEYVTTLSPPLIHFVFGQLENTDGVH